MSEAEEQAYERGSQAAYREMLGVALRGLGCDGDLAVRAFAHVVDIRATLRSLCDEFGDNDWPDDLHLSDVIEKHLVRHLRK